MYLMNDLIVVLIDKIKDVAIRGAIFRLYNNGRALVSALFLTTCEYLGVYFLRFGFPERLSDLASVKMWDWIAMVVLLQMLGIASAEKFKREEG